MITSVSAEIPFQAASDAVSIPFAAAIPESVSPSTTVWATAAVAPAGAQAATAAVATAAIAADRARFPPNQSNTASSPFVSGRGGLLARPAASCASPRL